MPHDPADSPFDAPELMDGYPLEHRERAALNASLQELARLDSLSDTTAPQLSTNTPFETPGT